MTTQHTHTVRGVAGADLSSDQYLFVYVDGADGERIKRQADGTLITTLGVLLNTPGDDEVATVAVSGPCLVRAGAAIEPYDYVVVEDTTGRATPATTGEAIVGQYIPNLVAATATGRDAADGDLICIMLFADKQNLSA